MNDFAAARKHLDGALSLADAAYSAGISDPAQLARALKLGLSVADFLGQATPSAVVLPPRFEKVHERGEHIITKDLANRIEWDVREFDGKRMDAAAFKQACIDLRTGGFSDWWRPTRRELISLVDDTRCSPAIDKEFFPNAKADWYRTRTVYAPDPYYRWGVGFGHGHSSHLGGVDGNYFVRAVRASQ